jgi:transcription elongation factor Elf1
MSETTTIFEKGHSIKRLEPNHSNKLTFLVKSQMKVIPAYKMILKRLKFIKKSNSNNKKSYIIKGMGKNITLTLKIANLVIESLDENVSNKVKIYTRKVDVYNKLITHDASEKQDDDFSDTEGTEKTVKIQKKSIPGVEVHIPITV